MYNEIQLQTSFQLFSGMHILAIWSSRIEYIIDTNTKWDSDVRLVYDFPPIYSKADPGISEKARNNFYLHLEEC